MTEVAEKVRDYLVPSSPSDCISCLRFSPTGENVLAAASWDSCVRIYDIPQNGNTVGKAIFDHGAPTLSVDWTHVRRAS